MYLHYDPHAKIWRGSGIVYTHQRMDFLMLLPNGIRIVIEIDGKQHYSEGDKSSPKLYSEMVIDTRELQLKGYEVYRFGGYEFMNITESKRMIQEFFEKLFKKYFILCVCVFCLHVYLYSRCMFGAHKRPEGTQNPLELELQSVISCPAGLRI